MQKIHRYFTATGKVEEIDREQVAQLVNAEDTLRSESLGELQQFPQLRFYLNDVYDHVLRATDFTDSYRDMLSGSLDAYQSSLATKINENMQWLTTVATIFATGTLITGFFGMNLRGMKVNSNWPYGSYLLLVILVVTTLFELWYFRRKGWI